MFRVIAVSCTAWVFSVLMLLASGAVCAAEDDPVEAPAPNREAAPAKGAGGFRLQLTDDVAEKLAPVKERTAKEQARVDSMAWFMTGELRQARNDFQGAYDAFKKAAELDPSAVEIYRSLIPLAFSLNHGEEALRYARKAVELDPEDYQLLRRLGVHLAAERQIDESLKLLEQALRSSRLKRDSADYVTLNRDLSIIYSALGEHKKAADTFEVLFDALSDPDKYHLDARTRSALSMDPNTSYERMGQAFLDAERPELAVKAFEKAAASRRGRPGNLSYNLARVYLQTKQVEKADAELQKYFDAQLQSKGRAAYELLAEILKAQEKSEELIARLEAMQKKDAHNLTLQLFLASQYVEAKQLDKAETLFKEALSTSADVEGYRGLTSIYRQQKKAPQLLEALKSAVDHVRTTEQIATIFGQMESELEAISQDAGLVEELIGLAKDQKKGETPQLKPAGALVVGKLAAKASQPDAAVEFFSYAAGAATDWVGVVYDEWGEHLLGERKYKEASDVYRKAVDNPALAAARPNYLFRLSRALELGGNTKAALESVREAIQAVPDHPLLQYQEAWIYYHSRQYDRAIELFEQVIARFPQHESIVRQCQFTLSALYVQKGELRKGEEVLEKVYAEDPDDVSVNNDLGYLYADQGKNLEQAEKMIRKAIAAEPDNQAYLDSMGWVLYRLEKYEEALTYLQKAAGEETGSDATILDHLGDCLDKLGKKEEARAKWQKALDHARQESPVDEKLVKAIEEKLGKK